jgi:O-antigen ligase
MQPLKNTMLLPVIYGLIIACPIIMVFAGRLIEVIVPVTAIIIVIHLIINKQFRIYFENQMQILKSPLGFFISLFIALIFIGSIRSYVQPFDFYNGLKLIGEIICTFMVGMFFVQNTESNFANYYVKSLFFAIILTIIMVVITPQITLLMKVFGGITLFNRVEAALVMWIWGAFFLTPTLKKYHILILIMLIPMCILGDSATARLVYPTAICVFIATKYAPKFMTISFFTLVISSLLFAPFLYLIPKITFPQILLDYMVGRSSEHRMMIWEAYSTLALMKPWFGWGFDMARHAKNIPEISSLVQNPKDTLGFHPHMQQLQIWCELGIIGAITVVSIVFLAFKKVIKLDNSRLPFVIAGLFSTWLVMTINFSLWQNWFIAMIGIQFMLLTMNAHAGSQTAIKSKGRASHVTRKRRKKKRT